MSHDDFEVETIRGLPGELPPGEILLWQGAPDWRRLAWRIYHVREVTAWFALLGAWRAFQLLWEGASLVTTAGSVSVLLAPYLAAAGILAGIARLSARTTVYSITSRRLVMRIGVVLPVTFNLPYATIARADAKLDADGAGDVSVGLGGGAKIAYLVLWPHARPWRLRDPEPTMRALPDGATAARLLADALAAAHRQTAPASGRVRQPDRATRPSAGLVTAMDAGHIETALRMGAGRG